MKKFFKDESGQGMVEYALILALIAIVVIAAVTLVGNKVKAKFESASTALGDTSSSSSTTTTGTGG